jgi:hypothetical protein
LADIKKNTIFAKVKTNYNLFALRAVRKDLSSYFSLSIAPLTKLFS